MTTVATPSTHNQACAPTAPPPAPTTAPAVVPLLNADWKPPAGLEVLLEQYKLFLEMTDRGSARRDVANAFFLTLHTAMATVVATAFAFYLDKRPHIEYPWVAIFPAALCVSACYAWYRRILSYRQLNNARFSVIAEFESHLVSSPYAREWALLGQGQNSKLYTPLTITEKVVPALFAIFYGMAALLFVCV